MAGWNKVNTRTASAVVLLSTVLFLLVALGATAYADSEFMKGFKNRYNEMGSDLFTKPPAEVAEISDFVYKKDVATFTFEEGAIYLLRHLDDRPTTAIFVGQGHATIDIPSHTERQSMWYAAGDSVVDESFESVFVNFADDFDLALKERFTFEKTNLPWRDFNKTQQGEFFFRPVVMHEYDHYFQLIRSHYERASDGLFWLHFNRHVFSFDPNRPEEVVVGYEHEGGDQVPTDGVSMQRMEKSVYDDTAMSQIDYPTTVLNRHGTLVLGGLDGKNVDDAAVTLDLLVNRDSLRFVSAFLHYKLKLDSVYYNGRPVDYYRRGSFTFLGVILPEYARRGDTVSLQLFYHGREPRPPLPFVENPAPSPHNLTVAVPKGWDVVMPGLQPTDPINDKYQWFTAAPADPYRIFVWQPLVTGYDTIPLVSDIGLGVNILKASSIDKNKVPCYVPQDAFEADVLSAFNFMSARLGLPVSTFSVSVYPEASISIPGLISVSQTDCYKEGTGGLPMAAGMETARQWFGALLKPRSDREYWLYEAVPDYLSLMHTTQAVGPGIAFGELSRRRDNIYTTVSNDEDWPLSAGRRVGTTLRQAKGSWLIHQLRYLMFDLQSQSDRTFLGFLNELKELVNGRTYTNADIMALAETHYGQPLDWFFNQWLFGRNYPVLEAEYQVVEGPDGYTVNWTVTKAQVPESFTPPVIVRVALESGESVYDRVVLDKPTTTFTTGPYAGEPDEVIFNEFFSILSKDKVKRVD